MVLRALILVALALALGAGGTSARTSGGAEEAYVAVEDEDEVVAVMLDTGAVSARIRVATGPHNVAVTRDRRFLLVTSPPAGKVTLIDAFTHRVAKVFAGLRYPHDVEVSHDGRHAYVTEERAGRIAVLDLARRRLVRRIAVGPSPHDLAVSPSGRRLWVTDRRGLAIIDARLGRVVGRGGSAGAHDIAYDRTGRFVWITYWNSGSVGKVRVYSRTGRLQLRRQIGDLVHHVQVDVFGRVWATDHVGGEVLRLSPRSARPAQRLGRCPGAHHVDVGPGRGRVVAACHDAGTILVWDPLTKRTSTIRVGAGPHGVAVAFVP